MLEKEEKDRPTFASLLGSEFIKRFVSHGEIGRIVQPETPKKNEVIEIENDQTSIKNLPFVFENGDDDPVVPSLEAIPYPYLSQNCEENVKSVSMPVQVKDFEDDFFSDDSNNTRLRINQKMVEFADDFLSAETLTKMSTLVKKRNTDFEPEIVNGTISKHNSSIFNKPTSHLPGQVADQSQASSQKPEDDSSEDNFSQKPHQFPSWVHGQSTKKRTS